MSRSMSRPLMLSTLALALWGASGPGGALADARFVDASARLDAEAFDLRLASSDALSGEPRVRTSPGFVRVWFPGMRDARLDVEGDGRAVRRAMVRPGVADTSVVIVRLGDMRRLHADAVAVLVDGRVAHVRIDRRALPRITVVEPAADTPPRADLEAEGEPAHQTAAEEAAAPADEAATGSTAEPATEPSQASTAEASTAEASTAEASTAEASTAEASTAEASTAEAPALALTRGADAGPLPAPEAWSTTTVLALLTVLLGAGYLLLRRFSKRRGAGPRGDIEIVATKRLGARHQLVVVRALGEDHLLAVQQGKTERLASIAAPPMDAGDAEADDAEDGGLPYLELGAPPESRERTLHRQAVDERPRFCADLMRLVAERSRTDRVSTEAPPAAPPSDAIAGLLRLREKLGR